MKRTRCALAVVMIASLGMGAVQAAELGLEAIEARLGWINIDEGDAGSTFGASVGADLGSLTRDLGLEVGIDVWSKGWDVGGADWTWTNIALLGNVRYDFGKEASFRPFLFGGVAFCYQSWDWEISNCQESIYGGLCKLDDSEIEFGVDLGVGADFGSGGSMIPTARAGYNSNGGADYFFAQGGIKFPMK